MLFGETFDAFLNTNAPNDLLLILQFRLLPFVAYAAYRARARPTPALMTSALSVLTLVALASLSGGYGSALALVCLGFSYFAAISVSVHLFAQPADALGTGTKVAVFVALFLLCVVIPSRVLPLTLWPIVVVVVHGFELTLSGYSYCCAVSERARQYSLGDAFFFMLVTPELVFPGRGEHTPPRAPDIGAGLTRAALGCGLMLAVVLLEGSIKPSSPPLSVQALPGGILSGALGFALLYGSHSALAHLQIGLCRVVGYRAPERYQLPFAAVSPRDFWSRWNRYIALWLRCYVHAPLVRVIPPQLARPVRILVATLGAFLFLGLFHDAYGWLIESRITLTGTGGFLAWGLLLWVWRPFDPRSGDPMGWRRLLRRETSRTAFLCGLCLSVWAFL